jgi:hypothetical protein
MVPEDLILRFFEAATAALEQMECTSAIEEESSLGPNLSLSDCRRCVLEKQKSVLLQTVKTYNRQHRLSITVEHAQDYLAGLNRTNDSTTISDAVASMEESARLAVCRLVLYSETHWKDEAHRALQTEGTLERSKILDFIALCQTSIRLPSVQKHLADGSPLFEDIPAISSIASASHTPVEKEPTAMKFPQARLERIQRYLSKAVGWDPEFTSSELRRLFFLQPDAGENANDTEIMNRFQQLILQMNDVVTTASLQASTSQMSDMDEGGVTRVVSVQCSEVSIANTRDSDGMSSSTAVAPARLTIDPHLTEEEQKRQIRIASEATRLQQEIVAEVLSMTEEQRNRQLDEAKLASEEFLKNTLALPPGRERIAYLQSVDPRTSRLLAIHKLWPSVQSAGATR